MYDGGRPTKDGFQEQSLNYHEVLRNKDFGIERHGKGVTKIHQVRLEEISANESLKKCHETKHVVKTI